MSVQPGGSVLSSSRTEQTRLRIIPRPPGHATDSHQLVAHLELSYHIEGGENVFACAVLIMNCLTRRGSQVEQRCGGFNYNSASFSLL